MEGALWQLDGMVVQSALVKEPDDRFEWYSWGNGNRGFSLGIDSTTIIKCALSMAVRIVQYRLLGVVGFVNEMLELGHIKSALHALGIESNNGHEQRVRARELV